MLLGSPSGSASEAELLTATVRPRALASSSGGYEHRLGADARIVRVLPSSSDNRDTGHRVVAPTAEAGAVLVRADTSTRLWVCGETRHHGSVESIGDLARAW